ncbi:hypothetical protein FJR74_02540 [Metamycoplasma neophronis]|uniref:Uncharacterized protein n=1 Tax=Metamycoplasma neophronis TaxID=872983 RepID=A0ABY2YZH1_9BACT|nr:hypothetical protein FJR74_02540 [Metamycoplasma neophronis]
MALNDKKFWRKINDIDVLNNNIDPKIEIKNSKLITDFINYQKFELNEYVIEYLKTKVVPDKYVKNKDNIYFVNVYWQIAMKISQLIQLLIDSNQNKLKINNTITDLAWLYYFHNDFFSSYKNIRTAFRTLILSNFYFAYFVKYKDRCIDNIELIKRKLENFINNDYSYKFKFKHFCTFLLKDYFLDFMFDDYTTNLIRSCNDLLNEKEKIWKKILEADLNNELNSLIINNVIYKDNFWINWSEEFISIAQALMFNAKDVRIFLNKEIIKKMECNNGNS